MTSFEEATRRLDDAVQEYVSAVQAMNQESGVVLVSWVMVATAHEIGDASSCTYTGARLGQALPVSMGLYAYGAQKAANNVVRPRSAQ